MQAKIIFLSLLLCCQYAFQTSTKFQIVPLESVIKIDPSGWTCENPSYKEQLQSQHDVEQWIDIFKHKDGFDGDLQILTMVKALVDKILATVSQIQNGQASFLQQHVHHQIKKHMEQLTQIESTSTWYDINDILGYVEVLNKAKTDEDKLQLASMIATKISELIHQITEIQLQLNSITIEIDDLYNLATKISEKTIACKDVWAPLIQADQEAEAEAQRKQQAEEEAQRKIEEEKQAAAEALAEEEKQKQEQAQEIEELKEKVNLTPEEAQELELQAEQELHQAEEQEQQAEEQLQKAQEQLENTQEEAQKDEQEAQEAIEKASEAKQALSEAQEQEEAACVDADEAERRLKAAQEAAEQARIKAEEADRLAKELQETTQCEPGPDSEPYIEESFEEEEQDIFEEESDDCDADGALEDLIDTLIDQADSPQAYQPNCGAGGCQEQPIIIIVEDDEGEDSNQQAQVVQEPQQSSNEQTTSNDLDNENNNIEESLEETNSDNQQQLILSKQKVQHKKHKKANNHRRQQNKHQK